MVEMGSFVFGQEMGNKAVCVMCLWARGALRALAPISGLVVQPLAESKTLWAWAAASLVLEGCPSRSREASFLPSSSSCVLWGSSISMDVVSGHCASALPADQAVDLPPSLQQPWEAPELASDPLPGAEAATGS